MAFSSIFNVFSRRQSPKKRKSPLVTDAFRNRILLLCRDAFSGAVSPYGENALDEFWSQIRHALQYRHGKMSLTPSMYQQTAAQDAIPFLLTCDDDQFIDFIEYVFRVDAISKIGIQENDLVDQINELMAVDDLRLSLTHMVKQTTTETIHEYPFEGREGQVTRVVSYPRIILREDEVVHGQVIAPTLKLLLDPALGAANLEFLGALEDYRREDYGDALTKAASALESTMKVICSARGWHFADRGTASDLIRIIVNRAPLDPFFEQPLLLIATIRNRLSTSHGGGSTPRAPSKAIARYSLNATGSAILFLAEVAGRFPAA